jgi:hypothetical protein
LLDEELVDEELATHLDGSHCGRGSKVDLVLVLLS